MTFVKNFNDWFKLKPHLNEKINLVVFQEREVWWCSIGINVGVETDGKNNNFERPVLIIKKYNSNQFFGFPLTSVSKTGTHFSTLILKDKQSSVMLSQGRVLDSKRLIRRLVKLTTEEFSKVKVDWLKTLA